MQGHDMLDRHPGLPRGPTQRSAQLGADRSNSALTPSNMGGGANLRVCPTHAGHLEA